MSDTEQQKAALHNEARTIIYTTFVLAGVEINITMREGATSEQAIGLIKEMGQVSQWLKGVGAAPILGRNAIATSNVTPNNVKPKQSPAPPAPLPSQPPREKPPMPASKPLETAYPTSANVEETDSVKITAPTGEPTIEFWRTGRKYPELKWHLGGAAFLKIAPKLAEAGWEAAHFDDIGQDYKLRLKVHWVQSPKNEKWKDIILVEPA